MASVPVIALQAFYGIFGLAEVAANGFYMLGGPEREVRLGRLQHGDLPPDCPDKAVRQKVRRMLVLGVLILTCIIVSLVTGSQFWLLAAAGCALLGTLSDAILHRFSRVYVAFGVATALFVATLLAVA